MLSYSNRWRVKYKLNLGILLFKLLVFIYLLMRWLKFYCKDIFKALRLNFNSSKQISHYLWKCSEHGLDHCKQEINYWHCHWITHKVRCISLKFCCWTFSQLKCCHHHKKSNCKDLRMLINVVDSNCKDC